MSFGDRLADLWYTQRRALTALILGLVPFWVFVGSSNTLKVNGEIVGESHFNVLGLILGIAGIAAAISALRERGSWLRTVLCAVALLVCAAQIAWSVELITRKHLRDWVLGWPMPDAPEYKGLSYSAQRDVRRDSARWSRENLQRVIVEAYAGMQAKFAEHKRYADACHWGALRADESALHPPTILGQDVIAAIVAAEAKTTANTKIVACSEKNSRLLMKEQVETIFAIRDELAIRVSTWRRRFAPVVRAAPTLHALAGDPLLAAAEQGDARAQLELGLLYYDGDGIAEDKAEAVGWFRKAAAQGSAQAQHNLGVMYDQGEGVAQDPVQAADWFRKAADQGHTGSQYMLAVLYENGRGVLQDDVQAADRYRKVIGRARAGADFLADAQISFGAMLEKGRGEPRDIVLAAMLYRLAGNTRPGKDNLTRLSSLLSREQADEAQSLANAWVSGMPLPAQSKTGRDIAADDPRRLRAEQGDAGAQYEIGQLYLAGRTVPYDPAMAATWLRQAAEQSHAPAAYELGNRYFFGDGVDRDPVQAMAWYRKAADAGNADGQRAAGRLFRDGQGAAQDYGQAMVWLRKAADQGDLRALIDVGALYYDGLGVPRDEKQAVVLFRKGADRGDIRAQVMLGNAYADGRGVPRDEVVAINWLHAAAGRGDAQGQRDLGRMFEQGRGVVADPVIAALCYRLAAAEDAVAKEDLARLTATLSPAQAAEVDTLRASWKRGEWVSTESNTGVDAAVVPALQRRAEQGDRVAQYEIARRYASGRGVPKDVAQGAAWLRKAADQGHGWAQLGLGMAYIFGHGVEADLEQAAAWDRKAAEQGYVSGLVNLANAYERGIGVPRDKVLAVVMARLALGQNPFFRPRLASLSEALSPAQRVEAEALAAAWISGTPLPTDSKTGRQD